MNRRHALLAIAAAATLLGLSSYASPYWTLHRMKTAVMEKDANSFSRYIDFPALRESVKSQLMVAMDARMDRPDVADNSFAGIGRMMGAALINPIVDAAVSPAGVIAMFESGKAQPLRAPSSPAPSSTETDSVKYAVAYQDWSTVAIAKPGEDAGRFILKRRGLWSWQLASLEFPKTVLQ